MLLVNDRSGRAAVQVPASSLMLDAGEIERRVRLIRPMEQHHASLTMMAESHWVEADRPAFASAWTVEVADVPAFSESTIHVVSRSEERRVGKECVRTCRSRWWT